MNVPPIWRGVSHLSRPWNTKMTVRDDEIVIAREGATKAAREAEIRSGRISFFATFLRVGLREI